MRTLTCRWTLFASCSSSGCCVHSLSMRCCRVGFCGWPSPPKLDWVSGPDAGASPAEAVKWPPESASSYDDHLHGITPY